jgi:hypothetical protein
MYNSFVRFVICSSVLAGVLFLASCAKDINNKEAVKEAVMKRLTTVSGLNMSGMEVEISSVSFQGDKADAQVAFKGKGSADAMLNMSYKLQRKGDEWAVTSTSGGMGGGASTLPPGHPPATPGGGNK